MDTLSGLTEPRTDCDDAAVRNLSPEHIRAIAHAMHLDLPPERVDALAHSLSDFLSGFEVVRALDTGEREPPTLTHPEEASA